MSNSSAVVVISQSLFMHILFLAMVTSLPTQRRMSDVPAYNRSAIFIVLHTASFTVAACFVGSRVLKRDWQKRWTEFRRFESMLHVSFIGSTWSMSHCVVGK